MISLRLIHLAPPLRGSIVLPSVVLSGCRRGSPRGFTVPDADAPPSLSRRRSGRRPLPEERRRQHQVACRLTDDELRRVDEQRGAVARGEWLRRAALSAAPRVIPTLNRDAWASLSRTAANLNQLAHAANIGQPGDPSEVLADLRRDLDAVRAALIGLEPAP